MKFIYDDDGVKMYVDNTILTVEMKKVPLYNEEKFDLFLSYFKNTWIYNNNNNINMYLKIIVDSNEDDVNIPISGYIKLVKILGDLHTIFKKNLHSLCILTNDKKIEDIYKLILKFYDPPDKRPILFTNSTDQMNKFFKVNKLID
tara:strand:- start:5209 stop:5643 length:435 start_codon:yes stop_codon:yes gene_type:complete